MPHFSINQFVVESDLELPAAPRCATHFDGCGNRLSLCHKPGTLNEFSQARWMGVRGGGFLRSYDVGDGALVCAADGFKMHVAKDGNLITLDFDEADSDNTKSARALSTNLGLSLCTLFRGDVPLHGAGVEVDGRFIGILAPSGAGKSTLLWALLDDGARFGNDDVIPVRVANGCAVAAPSVSLHAKLSRQALESRGLDPAEYQEWVPGSDEFWVPMDENVRVLELRPLAALFVLRPLLQASSPDTVRIGRVGGGMALSVLMENTQGLWAASSLVDGKRLFARYADILRSVPIYTLEYFRCREALPALVSTIRDLLLLDDERSAKSASEPKRKRRGALRWAA